MKTPFQVILLIVIGAATAWIVSKLIQKMTGGILLTKLVPFMLEKEGGLSNDPEDNASSYPAPWLYKGQSGWHTNKGITYQTFSANASRLGYANTPEVFFSMPNDVWLKILKGVYMSAYPLDKIAHLPRIQAVIITWAWGSGTGGSERRLANFQRRKMGIQDGDITKAEIVENFRKKINTLNERQWFQALCDQREADFRQMADFWKFGKGWLTRLEEFRKLFN